MKGRILILVFILSFFCVWPAEAKKAKSQRVVASHRVVKGDTLYSIARKSGMSVDALKRLNGLRGDRIKPGMVLQLQPKGQPTAVAKKSKAPTDAGAPPAGEAACNEQPTTAEAPLDLPLPEGDLEEVALAYLATPYRFGAETETATDCSGFTQQVFRKLGLDLPRTAREQFRQGEKVATGDWQRGDLLFFRTYARYPSHVGIYLQDGKMIHASRNKRQVVISDIDLPYFRQRYLGARRIATFDPVASLIEGLIDKVDEVNEEGILEGDVEEVEVPAPAGAGPLAALPASVTPPAAPPAGG